MAFKRIWHQPEVLAALDAGAWVITPGERLARAVRLAHGDARRTAGVAVWEQPQVASYAAFLDRLYDGAMAAALGSETLPPRRYVASAVEAVWEQAIRASQAGEGLLQPAAAAREARRAWELSIAYRVPLESIGASDDLDAQAFAAWAAE